MKMSDAATTATYVMSEQSSSSDNESKDVRPDLRPAGVGSVEGDPLHVRLGDSAACPWSRTRVSHPISTPTPAASSTSATIPTPTGTSRRQRLVNQPIHRTSIEARDNPSSQEDVTTIPLSRDPAETSPTSPNDGGGAGLEHSRTRGTGIGGYLAARDQWAIYGGVSSAPATERFRAAHSDHERRALAALALRPGQVFLTQLGEESPRGPPRRRATASSGPPRVEPTGSQEPAEPLYLVEFPYMTSEMVEELASEPILWRCWVNTTWAGVPKWLPTEKQDPRAPVGTGSPKSSTAVFVAKEHWGHLLECLEIPGWDGGSLLKTSHVAVHPDASMVQVQPRHVLVQQSYLEYIARAMRRVVSPPTGWEDRHRRLMPCSDLEILRPCSFRTGQSGRDWVRTSIAEMRRRRRGSFVSHDTKPDTVVEMGEGEDTFLPGTIGSRQVELYTKDSDSFPPGIQSGGRGPRGRPPVRNRTSSEANRRSRLMEAKGRRREPLRSEGNTVTLGSEQPAPVTSFDKKPATVVVSAPKTSTSNASYMDQTDDVVSLRSAVLVLGEESGSTASVGPMDQLPWDQDSNYRRSRWVAMREASAETMWASWLWHEQQHATQLTVVCEPPSAVAAPSLADLRRLRVLGNLTGQGYVFVDRPRLQTWEDSDWSPLEFPPSFAAGYQLWMDARGSQCLLQLARPVRSFMGWRPGSRGRR